MFLPLVMPDFLQFGLALCSVSHRTTAKDKLKFNFRDGNKISFSTSETAVKPAKSISEKWNYFLLASISLN